MNLCCFFGEISKRDEGPRDFPAGRGSGAQVPNSSVKAELSPKEHESKASIRDKSHCTTDTPEQRSPEAPDTPVPSTPPPNHASHRQSDNSGVNSNSTSNGSYGTSSSGGFSYDSNVGRPQPVQELHSLVADAEQARQRGEDGQEDGLRQASPDDLPPVKHTSRPSQNGSSQNGSSRWRMTDKSKLGSPIKIPQLAHRLSISGSEPDLLEGNKNFRVIHALTPGASSSVFLCLDLRSQAKVAIKLVSRGISNARAAEREIANLRLCGLHPYIIHMREVFLTSSHLALVFDYAPGGNLANYIETYQSSKLGRGISEERTRWIFRQIVVAVDFCHKMGIANRDIKLENVLLVPAGDDPTKPPDVKLSDFGFSKDEHADSLCKTACGTPESVAPEILSGELYDGKSSDIWSMGVLFFAMLTGTFPFSRPSDDELDSTLALRKLFLRISKAQYPVPHHISKSGASLLDRMLQVEPKDRIDIAGILSHPWFGNSMRNAALSVNQGLLDMPDSMLTGFALQSDEEIAAIIQASSHRPPQQHGQYSGK